MCLISNRCMTKPLGSCIPSRVTCQPVCTSRMPFQLQRSPGCPFLPPPMCKQVGRDPRPVMRAAYECFKTGAQPDAILQARGCWLGWVWTAHCEACWRVGQANRGGCTSACAGAFLCNFSAITRTDCPPCSSTWPSAGGAGRPAGARRLLCPALRGTVARGAWRRCGSRSSHHSGACWQGLLLVQAPAAAAAASHTHAHVLPRPLCHT